MTESSGGSQQHTISIHALREEGDLDMVFRKKAKATISIHALREEGDAAIPEYYWRKLISIHALREEGDKPKPQQRLEQIYFYPRPPRGGRRDFIGSKNAEFWISIHALREEGDCR